ncbi:SAG-related sequence SRS15C [Toxoplasma gondii FOU]|uniref:SAG-related sequence SRS15C n=1 Tax=Toxoplasma gondii FOU TaxID=943167 RepID=A0A086KGD3_TOXGO|nr:SAG-related sequence SRS15C [Toxoplasma gondii FOU]
MARSGNLQQRPAGFNPKTRKLIAVCLGGVLLLSSGHVVAQQPGEGLRQNDSQESYKTVTPTISGTTATCKFPQADASGEGSRDGSGSLTLSKENLIATLQCSSEETTTISPIPQDLAKSVCVRSKGVSGKSNSCNIEGAGLNGTETELRALLGTDRDIQWIKTGTAKGSEPGSSSEWTLKLQESDLPLSEKSFFVGCQHAKASKRSETDVSTKSASTKSACTVNVTVEARASAAAENNVVTCAYGQNSNPHPLKVEMTPQKNTVTLQCGSEGSLNPTSYTTKYCDAQEDMSKCTEKNFADILPSMVTSWWTSDNEKSSVKLTVPETDFPESEQQFRLRCVLNKTKPQTSGPNAKIDQNAETQSTASTSECNVIVTVKSGSSASSASQMVAAVSGAGALVGLLVVSL